MNYSTRSSSPASRTTTRALHLSPWYERQHGDGCTHLAGALSASWGSPSSYVDGHERPNVQAARDEHVLILYSYNEESYQHLEPMTIERARMWGFSEAVIEEGSSSSNKRGWDFQVGDGQDIAAHVRSKPPSTGFPPTMCSWS